MGLRTGQRLGKYRVQKRLAEGGFAEVYQAYDSVEGVPVALKIPHAHLLTAPVLEGFKREVRLAAGLDHPNILPIKNAEFIGGHFAIAYALGECTLDARMRRRLAMRTRVELAEQMLTAVAFAHGRRIIHCDVKPENLILFPGHRLRLTDFGISKLSARTVSASGSGTVGYVAPEQALGRPSFRSDVFSLGLILYELFSGALPEWPFRWPPPALDKLRRRAHPEFIALLRRALQVHQEKRFENAERMLQAFLRLKARNQLLAPARGRARAQPATNGRARDWRELRRRQFERTYKRALELRERCARCHGPVSEAMFHCPFCGTERAVHRGPTRHPARCEQCGRGRKLDWRFCPWCYGPGFEQVSTRAWTDRAYVARCQSHACRRRGEGDLMPFMRYCPWCRTKARRRWTIPGSKHSCGRCGWGVLPHYWSYCPWCAKEQPAR